MKIAMLYGAWCVGARPFNISSLWTDSRGLTGSELSFFCTAIEMKKRGHDVAVFTRHTTKNPVLLGEILVFDIDDFIKFPEKEKFNAICSWNEPDLLRHSPNSAVRLINQQLNDFRYCQPGFDDCVDVYTSPSHPHRDYIKTHTTSPGKWEVLPNGCDPDQYDTSLKVSGRVIYASSPDRGLHHLLQIWPKIRREVPHAHLKVFYNFAPWYQAMRGQTFSLADDIRKCSYIAMYIQEAMGRLKNHGVEHCHSISRSQMAKEMSEAELLAYPCDTVRYTEGFSVTLMEACASGTLPITTSVDSLGGIYGGVMPMVDAPISNKLDEFSDLVIRGLTDEKWRRQVVKKTTAFANKFKWNKIAEELESILERRVLDKCTR